MRPVAKSFNTITEATLFARLLESEIDRGVFVDRTVVQQLSTGLKSVDGKVKAITLEAEINRVRRFQLIDVHKLLHDVIARGFGESAAGQVARFWRRMVALQRPE